MNNVNQDKERSIKISIVTICFNASSTIENTIRSVISQGYKNLEYIIIDGGSTDGTIDIIRQYEDHIAYWVSEPDKGISDAFNKGVLKATGEIVGIINADDEYAEGCFYKIVETYQAKKLSETHYFIIYGDMIYKDYNKYGDLLCLSKENAYEDLLKCNMGGMLSPTLFVSNTLYKEDLFDIEYKNAMDYELFLRWHLKHDITYCYINEVLAIMNPFGLTNEKYDVSIKEVIKAYKHHLGVKRDDIYIKRKKRGIIKYKIRRFLEKLGLESIVTFYRRKTKLPENIKRT